MNNVHNLYGIPSQIMTRGDQGWGEFFSCGHLPQLNSVGSGVDWVMRLFFLWHTIDNQCFDDSEKPVKMIDDPPPNIE